VGADGESPGYLQRFKWEQTRLPALLRGLGANLYHATWNYGIPWNCPCPSLVTVHDLLPLSFPEEFGSRSFRLVWLVGQAMALHLAKRIITVSNATRLEILRCAPWLNRKIHPILEGIEPAFRPSPEPVTSEHLLYVGGFGSRKNMAGLFKGYSYAVKQHGVGLPLKLTGDSERLCPEAKGVYNTLEAEVREKISFIGHQSDRELIELYHHATALIFPSRGEGFGFPPLEAMACGTPVITTRRGSIPEVVKGNAHFVDPEDERELGEAISWVISDAAYRRRLIAGGLARAAELKWEETVYRTLRIYQMALGDRTAISGFQPLEERNRSE
jgi:glycosyltransferase involved in cell wall biosynthesis